MERKEIPRKRILELGARFRNRCEICGRPVRGSNVDIHHIDGNPRNNRLSNLLLVCSGMGAIDCHRQAHQEKYPKQIKFTDKKEKIIDWVAEYAEELESRVDGYKVWKSFSNDYNENRTYEDNKERFKKILESNYG
ncbi:hypothetical protein AKJ58_01305 [candidate division MSBL1 archaeon SCGC-AAA385D11]|uniref:HNH nuclease domain-containing protein n=1 Tax=candidate division MSBL1 archaeon SCGC-AAA385D11 TaxID=1698286 RepID=A0A133VNF6_9EURY|nr:hypothetical protein AKJ58_01305 [candidate division MSBL1 archaeon SCGC-AAA385D11]